ncbi:MAG: inverse autotransporter beta domain-containing protein [Planctomycetaceae bacterium]|nr:inverse autotransporter beta domain-containing protein [Planctomycetaceae bacterium]
MTNVRDQRLSLSRTTGLCRVADESVVVRQISSLRAGLVKAGLAVLMLTAPQYASAQGQTPFGNAPIGTAPSGSASGSIVNVNRRGLGVSVRAGHAAGDTVGRNESASFMGLSPFVNVGDGLIFGDTRLTYGNEGGLAWSFGGGYRQYLTAYDTIIGGYGYFDRDQLSGAHFSQWSVGGELISRNWETRFNYYQPFGNTSEQTASRVDPNSVTFVGQNIQFTPINTFSEALEGYDAEFGFLFPSEFAERFDIRGFGGGYSYKGEGQARFSGFSARLQADVNDMLELGLKLTDDEVFHTNVTFQAVFHIGGFESQDHTRRSAIQRLAEPVRRNLNIASNISDISGTPQNALTTGGVPIVVAHVDSNAAPGGTGDVLSPFNQLQLGLGSGADIVFVHAGSTFPAAPDNVITLANDQSVFGEGVIGFPSGARQVTSTITLAGIGDLTLPDSPNFATNVAALGLDPTQAILQRPTISNSVGDVVTMGNNSSFGGFVIDGGLGATNGIVINAVDGASVSDVLISGVGGSGILVQDVAANSSTTIVDTIIENATGPAFHVNRGAGDIGFNSTSTALDPSFASIVNSSSQAVLIEDRLGGSVNMFGATIDDVGGEGIVIRGNVPGAPSLGNVTIDNATITNSTGTGINVDNVDGSVTFRSTIRPATTIESATGTSVNIVDLGPSGNVTFEELNITTPLAGGINIDNLAGTFIFAQDLTIGAPGVGAIVAPAIRVANSQPTGAVQFSQDVTINGATGAGLELDSNQTLSSFRVNGLLAVNGAAGSSVSILNNGGIAAFTGGVQVTQRGAEGIFINNSTGAISFQGTTSILNDAAVPSLSDGVSILGSESNILFENLSVQNATLGNGVTMLNNLAGALGNGITTFQNIDITSTAGTGFFADNNTEIRIDDGVITTNLESAVDIANSGINIRLMEVNSAGSPDYGIRLFETNQTLRKTFTVTGDQNLLTQGTGGFITGAAFAGADLRNAGQVTLDGMDFEDNNIGIHVRNSGLAIDDDQFVSMQFTSITESSFRGIDAENLLELDVQDSVFTDNGDTAAVVDGDGVATGLQRETIFLNYTERLNVDTTTLFNQFTNPYIVRIQRNEFTAISDDVISINRPATLTDAHIDIDISQNSGANGFFILNDTNDFDPADVNENAIEIDWDGPALINIENNAFLLTGVDTAESQGAIFLDFASTTDLTELTVVGNFINDATSQPNAIGLDMTTAGPTNSIISFNDFRFGGEESQGMVFNLGTDTIMSIINNQLLFGAQGGFGIEVERVRSPSVFEISGNTIGLTDQVLAGNIIPDDPPIEQGIFFRSSAGPYTIFGTANNNIGLLPGSLGDVDLFAVFNGAVNGSIIVNGALVP